MKRRGDKKKGIENAERVKKRRGEIVGERSRRTGRKNYIAPKSYTTPAQGRFISPVCFTGLEGMMGVRGTAKGRDLPSSRIHPLRSFLSTLFCFLFSLPT